MWWEDSTQVSSCTVSRHLSVYYYLIHVPTCTCIWLYLGGNFETMHAKYYTCPCYCKPCIVTFTHPPSLTLPPSLPLHYRAARHGLKLSGKLKRVKEQEDRLERERTECSKELLITTEDSCSSDRSIGEPLKKRKRDQSESVARRRTKKNQDVCTN